MGLEGCGHELQEQAPGGGRLVAQAALLVDHVAFLVELAEHGVSHAPTFHQRPQLEAVGGERVEVDGGVVRGEGVDAAPAVLLDHRRVAVRHHLLARLLLRLLEAHVERREPDRIGLRALAALGDQGIPALLLVGEQRGLARVVLGAHDLGALEGHVLHHVGDAGRPDLIVGCAGVHHGGEAEDRGIVALDQDELQAVRDRERSHLLLERLEAGVLGGGCGLRLRGRRALRLALLGLRCARRWGRDAREQQGERDEAGKLARAAASRGARWIRISSVIHGGSPRRVRAVVPRGGEYATSARPVERQGDWAGRFGLALLPFVPEA